MSQPPSITVASPEELDKFLATIIVGFSADPFVRWMVPNAADYLAHAPAMFTAFAGEAFNQQSAYVANDGEAVALWLPPGVESDDEDMMPLMMELMGPDLLAEAGAVLAEMDAYHPNEDCWYLPMIAADPGHQGKGLGGALMKHALRVCDEQGLPAYLESTNERNVSLYERHGFEVIGEIQHGSSPVVRPMIREAV
ncbi:MAG: GNAT family N-acetyltransferase [Pseudomonadaceae bacterium]|nr:GNAT family N-acetyltransferase [Pseudomonadaceae bacterium]